MWKRRYGFLCAFACLVLSTLASPLAQSDPSTLPRIEFSDISYLGGFRLPDQFINGDGFTRGGFPIAFNPSRNSLFIGSRQGNLAEVAIPTVRNSNIITQLPFATFLQGFYEPTEGAIFQIATGGEASISGLLVSGDKLYGSASIYYDAQNTQRTSHYARSTTLSTTSVVGMRQVWNDTQAGFVSGYMSAVPAEWQAKLGGPAITGQCCMPIVSRTSWGPSAFVFNPTHILSQAKVAATPLLYYPDSHPTLGSWNQSSPTFGGTTQITGVAVIAGSRTVLYFGRTGTGTFCYGNGTNNQNLAGVMGPDGLQWCYDPTSAVKGQHAYPYHYQMWAYDLNDLAAVKAGTKQPWAVVPYGVWSFGLPFVEREVRIGGVGYDAARQIVYISQMYADQDGYGYRPIIHALKVGGAAGAPLPDPDMSTLPPLSDSTPTNPIITALSLTANKTAPQAAGTGVTFSVSPTGGIEPHQYKWLQHDGVQWAEVTGWSTSATFNWTPSTPNSQYRIGVWVRSSGNSADAGEKTSSMDFPIGVSPHAPAPYKKAVAARITGDKSAPQPTGSMITFRGTPTGGNAPHEYKWLVHDGARWTAATGWSTTDSFVWTPAIARPGYRIGLWVRSAGGTADAGDATASIDFPISGTAGTSPPPPGTPPPTGTRLLAVALSASHPEPQPAGTSVTFTAVPNGGAAPHQYKWLVHDGVSWKMAGDWSTSNAFTWTPSVPNSQQRFGVWVRTAGKTADAGEVTASMDFAINGAATGAAPPSSSPTSARLLAVALTADKAEPQPKNSTITFTATPNGGATPHEYKWLLHDGAAWRAVGDWTTSNTYSWTPTLANSQYRFGVWVRSAGKTADAGEVTASVDFSITGADTPAPPPAAATAPRLTAVTIGTDRLAPQPLGTTVTFTAIPSGGIAPQQYKWLVHNGAQWVPVSGWSTAKTFNWKPATENAKYRIGVWVRNAGNNVDAGQVTASIDYAIR